jgi:hypothetical protein
MADGGGRAAPPAGWYPDPWFTGQHRFWAGRRWTADTFPDGPDGPGGFVMGGGAPPVTPRPAHEAPPAPPPTDHLPEPPPPPHWGARAAASAPTEPLLLPMLPPTPAGPRWWQWRPSSQLVRSAELAVAGALVGALIAGLIVHAVDSGTSAAPTTPTAGVGAAPTAPGHVSPTPGGSGGTGGATPGAPAPLAPGQGAPNPAAPNGAASLLAGLVVRPADVPAGSAVIVIPGGDQVQGQPTLDLCNASYPSEARRVARLQDEALDSALRPTVSTEAVLYDSTGATAQAFGELAAAAAACPDRPVTSPVGEATVTTRITGHPDGSWPATPTVQRLAYAFTTTAADGTTQRSIVVYLRRGRVLEGIYFPLSSGGKASVAGRTDLGAIVSVFAQRIAALPTSAVR